MYLQNAAAAPKSQNNNFSVLTHHRSLSVDGKEIASQAAAEISTPISSSSSSEPKNKTDS
jgi:hypothetical protein